MVVEADSQIGMSICVLGDQHDIDRAKHHGVDAMSTDVSASLSPMHADMADKLSRT